MQGRQSKARLPLSLLGLIEAHRLVSHDEVGKATATIAGGTEGAIEDPARAWCATVSRLGPEQSD